MKEEFQKAAEAVATADALLITAGAGMGVDSGLPDFRGNEGFWNAYPPYRKLGRSFVEMANPETFATDPRFGWGFYGHRLNLYRETTPHDGFGILRKWGEAKDKGSFVMTSNVDGHFQRSGFSEDSVYEVHGSILFLQCTRTQCNGGIWPAGDLKIEIDEETMLLSSDIPVCPKCGDVARPNIMMFGDWSYLPDRNDAQERLMEKWLQTLEGKKLAIVELGAGKGVPTVRMFSERTARFFPDSTLIRINVREPEIPGQGISISEGALKALTAIDSELGA